RLATLRAVHEHLQLLAEELHRTVARLEIIALAGQMHVLDQLVEHPLAGENELIDSARLRCDMRLLHQLLVFPLERALLFIYGTSLASLRLISSGAMIPMPLADAGSLAGCVGRLGTRTPPIMTWSASTSTRASSGGGALRASAGNGGGQNAPIAAI